MLQSLHFHGYRSLRDFRVKLGRVTVVTGENGVGKSNLYRALTLLHRMAEGRLAAALAEEGGMPSALWAGKFRKGDPKRLKWNVVHEDFQLEAECGLIPSGPDDPTCFKTDPDVKLEILRYGPDGGRIMARRKGGSAELRTADGTTERRILPAPFPESILSEMKDGLRYPCLTVARETLLAWRFYHHFSTTPDSAIRKPVIGSWSPVLASDGANLAATLQTIIEAGARDKLDAAISLAFPNTSWSPMGSDGRFQLQLRPEKLDRALNAAELSDGTLRFFCLCAALLTPKPPPFLVLNEPESSLHADLMPSLAELISSVSEETQLLVVTHSRSLAAEIAGRCDVKMVEMINVGGETRHVGQDTEGFVWSSQEDDEE
jgi:predicted ATPase